VTRSIFHSPWTGYQSITVYPPVPLSFSLLSFSCYTCFQCYGGEIWDTKTLNLSHNIVLLQPLGRCFAYFTLPNQLVTQQKHLLRVEEMQCTDWLICLSMSKFVAWQVSLMKKELQSQKFVAQIRPAICFSRWSRKVKNAKHRPKTCNETMLCNKLKVFVSHISPPLHANY